MAGYPVSTPLIGRDAEKGLLERVLDGASKGRGGLLLISGPTGAGKSRLLEYLVDRAASRGFLVVQGQAAEGDTLPYIPFRRALEGPARAGRAHDEEESDAGGGTLPLAAAAVGGEGGLRLRDYGRAVGSRVGLSRDWGGTSMSELLAPSRDAELRLEELPAAGAALRLLDRLSGQASRSGVLIALENFQWADPASLALLRPVAREARKRPLVVAVSYDSDEPHPNGHANELPTIEEIARSVQRESGALRVPLRGLSESEVRRLAEEILQGPIALEKGGKLPEVLTRAQGNPFFVQEVVRAGLRDGWIVRRGDAYRVFEPTQDLQVPTLLRWWVHRRIQSLLPEDRTLLEAISVLGSEFDPRALPMLLPEMAPKLKRGLERLEVRYGVIRPVRPSVWQVEPGFMASVLRSEMSGEVLRRLHRHAGEWHAAHDPQAVERIAMHYYQAGEPALALPWLDRAWRAASERGDNDTAAHFSRQGEEMARAAEQPETLVRWQRRESTAIFQNGDTERALRLLEEALGTAPGGLARVKLLCDLSHLAVYRGDAEKAEKFLARAAEQEVSEDDKQAAKLRVRVHRFEMDSRLQHWEVVCRDAPELIAEVDRVDIGLESRQKMRLLSHWGTALSALGEFSKAREVLMDMLSRARRSGLVASETNARTALGILAVTMGDLAVGRAVFEQSVEEWRSRGAVTNQAINTANNAEILLHMGDLAEARRWIEDTLELCDAAGLAQVRIQMLTVKARLELESGDPKKAEEILRPVLSEESLTSQAESSREAHAIMARTYLAQGNAEAAWSEAQKAGQGISGITGAYEARTYAAAQAVHGEPFKAETLLNRIILETGKAGRKFDQAEALEELGGLLASQGRTSEARGRWDEALGLLRACGALGRAERLDERRKVLGASPDHRG